MFVTHYRYAYSTLQNCLGRWFIIARIYNSDKRTLPRVHTLRITCVLDGTPYCRRLHQLQHMRRFAMDFLPFLRYYKYANNHNLLLLYISTKIEITSSDCRTLHSVASRMDKAGRETWFPFRICVHLQKSVGYEQDVPLYCRV